MASTKTSPASGIGWFVVLGFFLVVAVAHGKENFSRDEDPLEQSRGCFEKVHYDFSRRISDGSQRELGRIMGEIADAEEKSVNPKEKGAMLKYFLRVLKRAEHVVTESRSFTMKDKTQMKDFLKHLRFAFIVQGHG
ncbi:hypothetical protein BIW11_02371 [Tropilaelaps mercedesae]|uniref:Uncharacterized protein n=1 Tax=Tropilaelaps mercedesae TaxID=418985 RepID=A0A1V9WYM9_9ACAR|nr:hypothetical protein BIW11_02371 [Tropilaelaps mercedesae]